MGIYKNFPGLVGPGKEKRGEKDEGLIIQRLLLLAVIQRQQAEDIVSDCRLEASELAAEYIVDYKHVVACV